MSESLADNYQRGGFGHSLSFGKRPALLVIDFVRAYLVKDSPLYAGVEQAHADCRKLLGYARAAAIPVIHTNVSFQPGGRDGGAVADCGERVGGAGRGGPAREGRGPVDCTGGDENGDSRRCAE